MTDKDTPGQLDGILRKRRELDDLIEIHFKRPVTILFADLVGCTQSFSTRDDIDGRLRLQRHNNLLASLVAHHRGNLIEIAGNTILAFFEQPSNAVACAVRMGEALAHDNQGRREQDRVQIRIGIHRAAEFLETDVYGVLVNVAERIQSLAGAGQILISESVYRALEPEKDPLCIFIDKVQVKDREEGIKVYRVVWEQENGTKRHGLRDSRIDGDLVLEVSRRDKSIELSVYERNERDERTLLPYEEVEIDWQQIEATCREVITLLNRANNGVGVTPETLSGLKKSGQILFDFLIPPKARNKLNSTPARNLILYVDDKLVHIPWEILFNGEEFLCRRFAMGRIVSTRQVPTFISTRSLKAPFEVLVLADPCGDLEVSYREGTAIKKFLDTSREIFHVDFKSHPADISFVKKNLRDYDIIHYAGHANYHPHNPSESGWLLNDGRLRASEVLAMGGRQPMPSLVFSNACQTAQTGEWTIQEGYEQRIFGLANAYLLSGVRHYIGTFWEISDEQSSYFAKKFYSGLARGENVGEAVRKARQELIEAYGEAMIVWATYILYGDPTFRFVSDDTEISSGASVVEAEPLQRKRFLGEDLMMAAASRRIQSPYLYTLMGILLLALGFFGYSVFYPKVSSVERFTSEPEVKTPPVELAAAPNSPPVIPEIRTETGKETAKAGGAEIKAREETKREIQAVAEAAKALPPEITAIAPPLESIAEVAMPPTPPKPAAAVLRVAELPKYQVGDSWTLRLDYGQTVTRKIRAMEKDLYVLEWAPNRWRYLDRELVFRKETTPEGKDWHPYLLNQRLIDFPLSVHKSWEFRIQTGQQRKTYSLATKYWRVFGLKVLGTETVQTPAGSFEAFKIEENSKEIICETYCEDNPNTSVIRHLWYAPETKFIVKVAHVSGEPWQGQDTDYELVAFRVK